jgi:hypothetical protein
MVEMSLFFFGDQEAGAAQKRCLKTRIAESLQMQTLRLVEGAY